MEPLIGQIIAFAGNFAPRGWAFCDGQMLEIEGNESLFAILGNTYGGDGRRTFGLPDLRGRVAMHAGASPGLTSRMIGQKLGAEAVALNAAQLPEERHDRATSGQTHSSDHGTLNAARVADSIDVTAAPVVAERVAGAPHDNMQPTLCVNYIIAVQGTFPSRG